MAYKPRKKKPTKAEQVQLDRDIKDLAVLIYDIYQEKKRKDKSNELPQDIR